MNQLIIDSSSWTGRDSTVHLGFRSKTQPDLIMVWRQWGTKSDGDYDYARVIWSTRRCLWRWQDRLRIALKMVCGFDNSRCSVCTHATSIYPGNPFKKAYCEEHCLDHDYTYERGFGKSCQYCGASPPWDYYDHG